MLTLVLSFSSIILYAQSAGDSLEKILKSAPQDSSRVLLLCDLAHEYLTNQPPLCKQYAEEALSLSKKLNYKAGEMLALNRLGEYEFRQSNYARAVEFSTHSLKLAEELHDSSALASVYRVLGNTNTFGFKQYDKALKYQLLALSINEKKKDMRSIASLCGNISWIYAITNQNLKEAHQLARRGVRIADSLGINQLRSYNYNSLGLIFMQEGLSDSALFYLEKSNAIARKITDRGVISYNNSIMGNIYLRKNDLKKALEAFSLAEKESRDLNSREVLKDSYGGLARTNEALGNFSTAYQYHKKFTELKDSLLNWETTQKTLMLEFEFNEQKREEKIAELEQSTLRATREKNLYAGLLSVGISSLLIIIVLIVHNNRQRRKANEMLSEKNDEIAQQNGKLKEANEIKDKLFFILGHDLRGPLSSLKSLLGMVARNEVSEQEFKMLAPQLNQNVVGISETLENLLQWSGSQLHGWQHEPVDFYLQPGIKKVLNLFEGFAQRKNINIVNDVGSEVRVHADQNQIELVFRNLIHNAIKFTSEGGRIIISAAPNEEFVQIDVTDTGVGISESQLASLFREPGIRSTRGTKGERGTGLGLTLCKEMITINGGIIAVTSEEGKGTTFHVSLKISH